MIKTGAIYPWNLEYYSALGINNFKFISNFTENARSNFHDLTDLKTYLDCIEYGFENMKVKDLGPNYQFLYRKNPKIGDIDLATIKGLFPDIKYFIKHGSECAHKCEVECNYCAECAKELEKISMYV